MNTKMARFRVDASRETGEVMLMIETECGFRPVMGWPDAARLREFTEMLMEVCASISGKEDKAMGFPDSLLREAFGDN
jgi:hypothetical protein